MYDKLFFSASIDEHEVKENSITVAENIISLATVRDALPTETVADISSLSTGTNEAVNPKSDVKEDCEMNVEVGMTTSVSECIIERESNRRKSSGEYY